MGFNSVFKGLNMSVYHTKCVMFIATVHHASEWFFKLLFSQKKNSQYTQHEKSVSYVSAVL